MRRQLGDGLILRNVENDDDAEKFAALNAVNNAYEGATCRRLLKYHPFTDRENFFIVENGETGEIVSTSCVLPWVISFCGVELTALMTEMVYTRPDYRKRGLIRKQMENIDGVMKSRRSEIGIINGIPFYYRQFGYSYCLHAQKYENLPAFRVPRGNENGFSLRRASADDSEILTRLYEKYAVCDIYDLRGGRYFNFLIGRSGYPAYILENGNDDAGYAVYYVRDETAVVRECGIPDFNACLFLLNTLKSNGANEIKTFGPESNLLVKAAKSLGSVTEASDQWLVKINDYPSFLTKLGPVFKSRLENSGLGDLTADLIINLYSEAYKIKFTGGELVSAENIGFLDYSMGADGGDIKIPRDAFVRLVFGFNTFAELADAWPDAIIKREQKYIADSLFPKLDSYLSLPFHYMGPLD